MGEANCVYAPNSKALHILTMTMVPFYTSGAHFFLWVVGEAYSCGRKLLVLARICPNLFQDDCSMIVRLMEIRDKKGPEP